jgi:hypothetical protein
MQLPARRAEEKRRRNEKEGVRSRGREEDAVRLQWTFAWERIRISWHHVFNVRVHIDGCMEVSELSS